jgi:hypothetical protein
MLFSKQLKNPIKSRKQMLDNETKNNKLKKKKRGKNQANLGESCKPRLIFQTHNLLNYKLKPNK